MRILFAAVLMAAAGPAAPQASPPAPAETAAPAKSPERPRVLNLKLDEPVRPQPRITFGPREGAGDPGPASTLPALGGNPSQAYERPLKADTPSSPFPKDTAPGR